MDFGSLLYAAHKNDKSANKETSKCYKTKFEPPKKEVKSRTNLSANIQKYLQKREEDEKKKADEEKKKKEELLALRSQDRKAFKRVQTMLKRTKSANKSVMEDAVDDVNTVVTMAGPQQCDEDDYGYVSQEATALYAKLMDKYSSMPLDEPKFPQAKKPVAKDLNAAKDRVKAALQKEEEEEMMPHKRKRKSKADKLGEENEEFNNEERKPRSRESSPQEETKPKKPKKMAPPPMDFTSLLKLAEQKQFEPVKIEKKVEYEEEEDGEERRPMTKKQKLEYERERDRKRRRMEEERARKNGQRRPDSINRIPKVSDGSERKDKPSEFGRIQKKSTAESRPQLPSFKEGRRKDSVDSDSSSRNHSYNDHSRKDYQTQNDRPRSNHQLDTNRQTSKYSSDSSQRKPVRFEEASIAANKARSRSHNISDDEQSGVSDYNPEEKMSTSLPRNRLEPSSKQSVAKYSRDPHPERNGFKERFASNADNDMSDSYSSSDNRKQHSTKKYSDSPNHKRKPEVKLKHDNQRYSQSSKSNYNGSVESDSERSCSPDNTRYNNKYRQARSDSETEDESKYVPSKKISLPNKGPSKRPNHERPMQGNVRRSRSPENARYRQSKPDEPSRNPSSVKEKKIKSLFEGSDEENHDYTQLRKEFDNRRPKPSYGSERQNAPSGDSKFRIPKGTSKPDFVKAKVPENSEKYKLMEKGRSSPNSNLKPALAKGFSKQSPNSSRCDRPSSSKLDVDKNQSAMEKNRENPRNPSEQPKPARSPDSAKKPPGPNAEEALKKNANVWSKPCNLAPTNTPKSGLSASQIERLRQMNKKPTPARPMEDRTSQLSKPSPRDERKSDGRPLAPRPGGSLSGKPSLLKAAAVAAANKAQKSQASSNLSGSLESVSKLSERQHPARPSGSKPSSSSPVRAKDSRLGQVSQNDLKPRQFPPNDVKPRQFPPNDVKPRQFPPNDVKPRQFPPNDLKPRQFPPNDLKPRQFPPNDMKRKPKPRRIDSESEEYDSEMDDFIDDGEDMNQEQISREIQSIFGYDKSRYLGMDEDECMESNFGQIDKEEHISLRIGAKEDYEELQKEMARKKRAKERKRQEMLSRR